MTVNRGHVSGRNIFLLPNLDNLLLTMVTPKNLFSEIVKLPNHREQYLKRVINCLILLVAFLQLPKNKGHINTVVVLTVLKV